MASSDLRTALVAIQRNPTHARIGEIIGRRVEIDPKTKKEKVVVIRRSTFDVCPRCPVRRGSEGLQGGEFGVGEGRDADDERRCECLTR